MPAPESSAIKATKRPPSEIEGIRPWASTPSRPSASGLATRTRSPGAACAPARDDEQGGDRQASGAPTRRRRLLISATGPQVGRADVAAVAFFFGAAAVELLALGAVGRASPRAPTCSGRGRGRRCACRRGPRSGPTKQVPRKQSPLLWVTGAHVAPVRPGDVDVRLVEAVAGEDDAAAVGRDVGFALVADAVDQDPLVGAVGRHREDVAAIGLGVDVGVAGVDDAAAVRGEDRVPGAAAGVGQRVQAAAVDVDDEDPRPARAAARGRRRCARRRERTTGWSRRWCPLVTWRRSLPSALTT